MEKIRRVILPLAIIAVAILLIPTITKAQTISQTEGDVIGIRVVPNPNHYSIYRWYQGQGFSGSPQPLSVDGYEALRDGRTVYINAAHVDTTSKKIYTNIYLISYNQDPNVKTVDILGQIISHWTFNDNLPSEISTCSISSLKCTQDADCASNQSCNLSTNTCALKEPKSCSVDDDCPANFFCGSVKAKIVRDLKRVGRLEEIREALVKYREANGSYPLLSAGTYLPNRTTSLWPSWTESFLPSLGLSQNIVDPINRFGICTGYDDDTCWNKDTKQFVYPQVNTSLTFPYDSHVLAYSTNPAGSEYNLCAVMESRDPSLNYQLEPSVPNSNCVTATGILATGSLSNTAPRVVDVALNGISGREFNGFVRALDQEGDPITWSLSAASFPGWSAAPIIKGTSDPNQKKIYADRAGAAGTYPITITVSDNKGGQTSTTTNITINPSSTAAQVNEYTYRLDPTVPFNFSIYAAGENSLPTYTVQPVSGYPILATPNIKATSIVDGVNRYKITYSGIISTSSKFSEDTESIYRLVVGSVSNNFLIRVKVDPPVLDFNCETQSRLNYDYSCRLGSVQQGNHTLSYASDGPLPPGLEILESETEPGTFYLTGKTMALNTGQEVRIKATNEYGNTSVKSFVLRVNTYCGDGIKQTPNSEGRGGMYNNGNELCDGQSGLTTDPNSSDPMRQYACSTPPNAEVPYPITNNSYCVFKSPLEGGGYCGDLFCQTEYENISNCEYDCSPTYFGEMPTLPDGEATGEQSCAFTGTCPSGQICVKGVCQDSCWQKEETVTSVLVQEGDAAKPGTYSLWESDSNPLDSDFNTVTFTSSHLSGCGDNQASVKVCTPDPGNRVASLLTCQDSSVIRIDDPMCRTLNLNNCPTGCNSTYITLNETSDSDQCKTANTVAASWDERAQIMCYGKRTITRCIGDPCRRNLTTYIPAYGKNIVNTAEDGIINLNGDCVDPATITTPIITNNPNPIVPTTPTTPTTGGSLPDGTCVPFCYTNLCGGGDGCGGTCGCPTGFTCQNTACVCNVGCAYSPAESSVDRRYNCYGANSYCNPTGGYCGDGKVEATIFDITGKLIDAEECDNGANNTDTPNIPYTYDVTYTYCTKDCKEVTVHKYYCGDGVCDISVPNTKEACGQACVRGNKTYYDCSCNSKCTCPVGKTCSNGLCILSSINN